MQGRNSNWEFGRTEEALQLRGVAGLRTLLNIETIE
jgi:hypothetical protein